MYPQLEHLIGDRDPAKGDGLKALEGRTWDAVIDNSGYYTRHVKASAELLAPRTGFYLFVSSVSALASHDEPNSDETAATGELADPNVETMGAQGENYGPLKAACERAVTAAYGEARACNVRPGYIVGPFDGTDRFTYWPLRVRKGGEIPVPGAPTDPVQIIDVRDLGEWMVRLCESTTAGLFNACGPKDRLEVASMLRTCKEVTGSDATFTYIDPAVCQKVGFQTPIVLPMIEGYRGFHTVSNARAVKAGLAFRPLAATIKDTLAWFDSLPAERREKLRADVAPEKEAEALAAAKAPAQ
jgi:2'-hydroxyisoflavone reductase